MEFSKEALYFNESLVLSSQEGAANHSNADELMSICVAVGIELKILRSKKEDVFFNCLIQTTVTEIWKSFLSAGHIYHVYPELSNYRSK